MKIQINNNEQLIPEGSTVKQVIFSVLELQAEGMAIAINDAIVPRSQWDIREFKPNDKMLIIKASKGG